MNMSQPSEIKPPELAPMSGGFNINQMLEQITQEVTNDIDDSPASPPHVFEDPWHKETKMIPVLQPWRLETVEEDIDVNSDFEYSNQLIQVFF